MVSISNIKGSNGSGQAVRGAVTDARAISSTTLKVDSVTNYPSQFIATTGKLGPSGILDNTTVQVFFGHLSGADIIIDSFAPGYTDKGNSVADVVILKPTTAWADEVAGVLDVTHNDNGTIKNNAVKTAMLDAANIDASVALKDASITSSKIDFTTFKGPKIIPVNLNTTGSKVITGVGFKPKFVQWFLAPPSGSYNIAGSGGTDGTANYSSTIGSVGGSFNTFTTTSAFIETHDVVNALICKATFTSFNNDGMTINVTNTSGSLYNVFTFVFYP